MSIFEAVLDLERNDEYHMARLLVLLRAFGTAEGGGSIDGLTKLAKLDFLLRYPTYLERALEQRKRSTRDVEVQPHERRSVESRMIRFRYGPWDHRYRRFINTLVARGLAAVHMDGRKIVVSLSGRGAVVAETLAAEEAMYDHARRAALVQRNFDWRGTRLMEFIYGTFPEIASLRYGEEIR